MRSVDPSAPEEGPAEAEWAPPDPLPIGQPAAPAPPDGVGGQTAAGIFWLTVQKWGTRLFGFVTIAILTRLLTPADFGTVAAASTVLPFFFLLADLGFAAYIVQVERVDRRMLSTAFWFSMTAGAVFSGVMFAIAPLLGVVFRDEGVVPVLQALSSWVILTALGSVPMAILRRGMRFKVIAAQAAAAAAVAQVVAIAMALGGWGVWALVGQSLVAPLFTTILAWISSRWRPAWRFSRSEFKKMASFGSQVLGVEFVALLRGWGEAAVISGTLGIAALGYMNISQRLIQVVQDLTGSAIVPVTTVAFARMNGAAERLRGAYSRAVRTLMAVLAPPLTLVAVTAPLLIPILFGKGWEPSYQVAQILAIAGTLTITASLDHGLFYGLGQPGTWFTYAVVIDALTLGVTIFTARWGLVAIAAGFLVVCVVATVCRWFLTARLLGTSPARLSAPFLYLACTVVLSGAAGWGVTSVSQGLPSILRIALAGIAILAVHLLITRLLAPGVLKEGAAALRHAKQSGRIPLLRSTASDEKKAKASNGGRDVA
jgi:O-antigen/teichoic acid export membrane protein